MSDTDKPMSFVEWASSAQNKVASTLGRTITPESVLLIVALYEAYRASWEAEQ